MRLSSTKLGLGTDYSRVSLISFRNYPSQIADICSLTVKDVHKAPALDLVGWYTILPTSGPQPIQLPIHRQILDSYNESAILLGFHPEAVLEGSVGGKLPLTIYEINYEADDTAVESGEDKEMKDSEPQLGLRFKELPYSVETGEAEMISVDFVARGGGNATAVNTLVKQQKAEDVKGKGKTRSGKKAEEEEAASKKEVLSREDEELIASLTATRETSEPCAFPPMQPQGCLLSQRAYLAQPGCDMQNCTSFYIRLFVDWKAPK